LRLANLLREWMNGMQDEDLAACRIFIKALEAPMKQMLENVGLEAGPVLARLDKEIPSFEIENGELVMGGSSKVLDSNLVVREVIYRALKSAALALTTDVIVHSPNPERAMTPE
jgi:chaperonin GroEL